MSSLNLVLMVTAVGPIFAQDTGEPPPQRTYPVLRLNPSAFPELPKSLVGELQRRGCTTAVYESQGERDPGPVLKAGTNRLGCAVRQARLNQPSRLLVRFGSEFDSAFQES